jgi:hypothetical protein
VGGGPTEWVAWQAVDGSRRLASSGTDGFIQHGVKSQIGWLRMSRILSTGRVAR